MQLNPTLNKFYLSVLAYAGMKYENGIISNVSDKIGDIKIDGKHLTLPYHDNLCNPGDRHIFHPLNENYTSPETAFLNIYKKRLTLEINMKVSAMIVGLITVAADIHIQKKIKSTKLIEMLSEFGEVDITTIEHFVSIIKHSQKVNSEGFILDFHVKKNGNIDNTPYAAVGKVTFSLYNELNRALKENEDGYKVYGYKTRKKDILTLINIISSVFKDIDSKTTYTVGTDMKVFRYFNALLLSTYTVTHRVNEVASLLKALKEPSLAYEEMVSDLEWSDCIEEVYNLSTEIRQIPNQTNPKVESNHKLSVKEPVTQVAHTPVSVPIPPTFNPSQVPMSPQPPQQPQAPQPAQQVMQQPQTPQVLSPEDIIRGQMQYSPGMYPQGMYPQQPMMQHGMYPQQPMPVQPPTYHAPYQPPYGYPANIPQQPVMGTPMYPQQQPMMQQPPYQQQPGGHPGTPEQMIRGMAGSPQQQSGIPLFPHMFYN